MKINFKKAIIIFLLADMLVCIGIVIGLNINSQKIKPKASLALVNSWSLGESEHKAAIQANYWNFVHASYILIGNAPDYEYYKIVSEVPRNNYGVDKFYADADGIIRYHNDDGSIASTLAVDVSSYVTNVDWEGLKANGVDVAIIRCGYRGYGNGTIVTDTMFESHVNGALTAGMRVGVYFFTQAISYEEGVEEASYVLNLISSYDIKGPVVIDTEIVTDETARTTELSIEDRTNAVVGFCETVRNAGYTPMIYSNRNWFVQNLDMTKLGTYKLWVAQYSEKPDFPYLYTGWQYTDQGSVAGLGGNLDLNVWFE